MSLSVNEVLSKGNSEGRLSGARSWKPPGLAGVFIAIGLILALPSPAGAPTGSALSYVLLDYWSYQAFDRLSRLGLLPLYTLTPRPQIPKITQFVLQGGRTSTLGIYAAAGLGFELSPGTILTLGTTFTDRLGIEPLVSLSRSVTARPGWNLGITISRGDLGGDYRVDRLPEITLTREGPVAGTVLTHRLEAGVGHFIVRPNNLSGVRVVLAGQLATASIPLSRFVTISGSMGFRQHAYADGASNGAWWESAQLSVTPGPTFSTTFTYFRQTATGASPLLFDGMGAERYVAGAASFKPRPSITLQHSQQYSLISQTISARVYGATIVWGQGQSASVSWNDIPQMLTVTYGRAALGSLSVSWEIPTRLLSFSFQR